MREGGRRSGKEAGREGWRSDEWRAEGEREGVGWE